jgi:hypothetical protein
MYQPQHLDDSSPQALASSLRAELGRLALEFSQPSDYMALNTLYAAPGRIFDGMIVKADGTTWNPGSGAGVYAYVASAWVAQGAGSSSQAFPIGSIFTAVVSTNPATLLGYGTWTAFGAGKVPVGLDSGDVDFDTAEEVGGAKTKALSAHSGTAVGDHAAHTHSVTSNVTVADHSAHTHSVTSNVTVADHGTHTHTYTQVPNHTHPHNLQGGTTGSTTGTNVMGSTATGGSARAMAIATSNPTGGVATGTTAGPDATQTHTPTNNAVTSGNPSATLSHTPTNNAVTSGNPSATLTHSVTQPAAHTDLNVVQPYIVVYMWKRTA